MQGHGLDSFYKPMEDVEWSRIPIEFTFLKPLVGPTFQKDPG